MREIIISAGIDIGTSTTQLIFSKITMENRASSYSVPRIVIVDKEVIYRSDVYFTPLSSQTEIDATEVLKIIEGEYKKAGMSPKDIDTGAIIITGETARKSNASTVLNALSGMAGDFVVATAGPDLESVLSGRGAGADTLSKELFWTVANIDIGGGTSNVCVFNKGNVSAVSCLDIGGRLIKITDNKISYIYTKIAALARENGININIGDRADVGILTKICNLMADVLSAEMHIESSNNQKFFHTNDGDMINQDIKIDAITFSGGVADYIYNDEPGGDVFKYGDIGILLGRAIKNSSLFSKIKILKSVETLRATVVGAGTHTTEISGSTISYNEDKLPIKNIPVIKINDDEPIEDTIKKNLTLYMPEGNIEQVAIAFSGTNLTSYISVQETAQSIISGTKALIESNHPLIIVVYEDIAKVLGNALNILLQHKKDVICIDGIKAGSGDYIDIGNPIADGQVIPVVIKTLIFNS